MQLVTADPGGARAPSTSFVGRRGELASLRALLARNRLLTIIGPGGSGKTRLAEELVASISRSFDRNVAVAYLAGASTPAEVGEVVMAAVGLRARGEPLAALADYFGDRRVVLVLDNCEHLRRATAELVMELQGRCTGLVVLATSRRALVVPGEQLFPIAGLSDAAALTLFTERVRLASPSFVLSEAQQALAAGLCARLEGMPLGIELAAARLRHLGLADLAERLARRLGDLGSAESLAPARQRTLRGAVDWSHELLDESQRVVWRRLSVFADGFTLAAAESVVSFAPITPEEVEPILGELVDQSMVAFDLAHDRYRLIEAMREYAQERLWEAGENAPVGERHRAWMLSRALDLERRWWGPHQAQLLDAMTADAANLRAALESARVTGDGTTGLRIATWSRWYWMTRASHAEAERWFLPFLDHTADPGLAATANLVAAWMSVLSGHMRDCCGFLDRAEELAAQASDPGLEAYVGIVRALEVLSDGDLEHGVALARAVLANPEADPMCRSWASLEVGIAAFFTRDLEACLEISSEAIRACIEAGETWSRVPHLHLQAAARWQLGETAAAVSLLLDALRIDRRLDDIWHKAWSIEALGWMTADLGQDVRAARLLGIAQACWAYTGSSIMPPWQVFRDAAMAKLGTRLGEERLVRELAAGRALDRARAMSYALEEAASDPVDPVASSPVSARELEVAALVAEGFANRQIGERLFLSHRTVETHVQHLMDKLGVSSRAEIAAWHARVGSEPDPA